MWHLELIAFEIHAFIKSIRNQISENKAKKYIQYRIVKLWSILLDFLVYFDQLQKDADKMHVQ